MLGRYVAGTLLVLGVAMIVAPESPKMARVSVVSVARTEASPAALETATRAAMAAAVEKAADEVVVPVAAPSKPLHVGVEAALIQALALDDAEGSPAGPDIAGTPRDDSSNVVALAAASAATEPVSPSADRAARYLFVTGTKVNVREGPSTQFRVVGAVSYGDPVELIAYEGRDWARIRIGDNQTTGYMSRKFLASELSDG